MFIEEIYLYILIIFFFVNKMVLLRIAQQIGTMQIEENVEAQRQISS